MKATEVLREMIYEQGYNLREFGEEIGMKERAVSKRLRLGRPSVQVVADTAKSLGYKVVLVPEERRVEDDEYEIEG